MELYSNVTVEDLASGLNESLNSTFIVKFENEYKRPLLSSTPVIEPVLNLTTENQTINIFAFLNGTNTPATNNSLVEENLK
jgi:hypothetical protein